MRPRHPTRAYTGATPAAAAEALGMPGTRPMMISVSAMAVQTGLSGDLGRPLSSYLDALDSGSARAHRRAWRRLARAHQRHQYAVALLPRRGIPEANPLVRSALAVTSEFAALAHAERRARPVLCRRP